MWSCLAVRELNAPVWMDLTNLARVNFHQNMPSVFNPFKHLHPPQAANCCRNSRLVVDEDDLTWFKN